MHPDEVHIDLELVRSLIAATDPDWAGLPLEAVPSIGTVNALYRLGEDMVVRLPRVARWAGDLLKEVRWLPTLAPHLPLDVPIPIATGQPAHGYPFHWAIFTWLPGTPLTTAASLDLDQVVDGLVGLITALHRVGTEGGPPSTRDRPLAHRQLEVREALDAIGTRTPLAAWEESVAAAPWTGPPAWTHGDLLPPNLLTQDGRLTGAVDFGNMGVGDPAVDLIPAWTVLTGEHRRRFRAGLPHAHDEDTWRRARGMALHQALMIIPYYKDTNPLFSAGAMRTVEQVLEDAGTTQ